MIRINGEVGLAVATFSLPHQLLDLLAAIGALEQRTLRPSSRSGQQGVDRSGQTDQGRLPPQQIEVFIIHDDAAAGSNHLPVELQDLVQRSLLQLAKIRFAFGRENLPYFFAFGFFDQAVEIDKAALQSPGEISSHGALSDRHKTDQRDVSWQNF